MKLRIRKFTLQNVFILFCLFFAGFASSLVFNTNSFSTLTYVLPSNDLSNNPTKFLNKNDKIRGDFVAPENNLGIVEVRFDKYQVVNYLSSDVLLFRIKDSASRNWYYEKSYNIFQFEKTFILPFGFPMIVDSKGKKFVFEISSLNGNRINSVKLSSIQPNLLSVYKISKRDLLSSPTSMFSFFVKKAQVSLLNQDFLLSSVFYFIPFISYLLYLFLKSRLNFTKKTFYYLVPLLILLDSFIIPKPQVGITLLLLGFWAVTIVIYKFDSSVSFAVSFMFVILTILLTYSGQTNAEEKLAIYIYSFLLIGIIQYFRELKSDSERTNYREFMAVILRRKLR